METWNLALTEKAYTMLSLRSVIGRSSGSVTDIVIGNSSKKLDFSAIKSLDW